MAPAHTVARQRMHVAYPNTLAMARGQFHPRSPHGQFLIARFSPHAAPTEG